MEWYLEAFRRYADFSGRSRRKEYWIFHLVNGAIGMAFGTVVGGLGGSSPSMIALAVLVLFGIATFIPSLAVTVRRLHDTSRSGWWFFIVCVPFVGALVLLVFMLQDSHPGPNEYGPNPKALMAPLTA